MSTKQKPPKKKDGPEVKGGLGKDDVNMPCHSTDAASSIQVAMDAIAKELTEQMKALRDDIRNDLRAFKEEIKAQVKLELSELKVDIDRRFRDVAKELHEQKKEIEGTQARIIELEEWNVEANELIQELLRDKRKVSDKLEDLESRSRRNNLRIFGIPEDSEKSGQTIGFVTQWLKEEFGLDMDLQIQRAHRALTEKPDSDSPPRSLIVNFLQYSTKELVLSRAWEKKDIKVGNSKVFFDHDYSLGVLKKRREYRHAKKVLKERGVRFRTPFTKILIHWPGGKKLYNTAEEATAAVRQKGWEVDDPGEETAGDSSRSRRRPMDASSSTWRQVGRRRVEAAGKGARLKLQMYRHPSV